MNTGATQAQLAWTGKANYGQKKKHTREDLESFYTAYNAACLAIARGELREGEFLLKAAEGLLFYVSLMLSDRGLGLCASLDELTESEKTAEVLPIKIQKLCLLCQLGKLKEAEVLVSSISVQQ